MRVNLRGYHVLVAKLFLNGANIRTRFQQVGGKGMAQSVAGDLFFNARERRRSLNHLSLHSIRQCGVYAGRKIPDQDLVSLMETGIASRETYSHWNTFWQGRQASTHPYS